MSRDITRVELEGIEPSTSSMPWGRQRASTHGRDDPPTTQPKSMAVATGRAEGI